MIWLADNDRMRVDTTMAIDSFEQAPVAMEVLDLTGRFLCVNAAMSELTGYGRDELVGSPTARLTHPDHALRDEELRGSLLAGDGDRYATEKRVIHAAGHPLEVSVHVSLVRAADGAPRYFVGQILDIRPHKQLERDLQHLADHDPLTGLLNRRRFEAEVDRHVAHIARYGRQGAALVLDIDRFKQVNDALGHGRGDELIIDIARILQEQLRRSDQIARLGGDEFAVLLPSADRGQAARVARKLLDAVREGAAILPGRAGGRVTISVGVMMFDECEELTAADVIVDADLAMYEAKEAGRDTFAFFEPDGRHDPRIRSRASWYERIEAAIERDGFRLQAQPIVDLRSGEIEQHELLIRMLDHDGDLIPPSTFLSVAERYGQIAGIDKWVAHKAIELLAEMESAGLARPLAINLSRHALGDRELVGELEVAITDAGIDPQNLVVEIGEAAAVADIGRARALGTRLRELGCRFALDDFGAGVGSIYHLKHLPLDYIKIDGEFVRDCMGDRRDRLAIGAVVELARGLRVATIAEAVTDAGAADVLRDLGVDFGQGRHFGWPVDLRPAFEADRRPALRPPHR
ncbi:MAG: EAL domain-containing protein [Actinobacteria bacterium]|nr:EAL domain-containing protein [Actinomycetota bacterium]MBS1883878.1 EAL domain-containing protein [Actinomycetota bacterium]